jgi:VanZ family protein
VHQHGGARHAAGSPLTSGPRRGRALALAILAAIALVLAAPAIGTARSALRAAFPGAFARIVEGTLALGLLAALGIAVARIRTHRAARYALIAIAIAAACAYSAANGSRDPAIRAVEHVHFLSFGTIAWLFYRVWRDRPDASALVAPFLAAFLAGIADEAFQWFLPARVGELADVALNGVAIGCGLLFGAGLTPPAAPLAAWSGASVRLVARLLAIVILALAGFIHLVHLGHAITDPTFGTFASRFTPQELDAAARDRTEAWRAAPPMVRPPRFSREDQYMTEGLQHVQARNTAWDAGDAFTAWRQNLILERFFAPVLDAPSYVAKAGHRWSAQHRADAGQRVRGTEAQPFASHAFPYPLFFWSPVWLWLVAGLGAAALWVTGEVAGRRASHAPA